MFQDVNVLFLLTGAVPSATVAEKGEFKKTGGWS
jgi:hypothetical protein